MFSYWQTFGYNEKSKNDKDNDKKIIKKTTSDIIVKQPIWWCWVLVLVVLVALTY